MENDGEKNCTTEKIEVSKTRDMNEVTHANNIKVNTKEVTPVVLHENNSLSVVTLEQVMNILLELKSRIMSLESSSSDIHCSLKMLEMVVCTKEDSVQQGAHIPPNNGCTSNLNVEQVTMEQGCKTVETEALNAKTLDWDDDSSNIILGLSDEEVANGNKLSHSLGGFNFETSLTTMKPQLPTSWTQKSSLVKEKLPIHGEGISGSRRIVVQKEPVRKSQSPEIVKKLFLTPSPKTKQTMLLDGSNGNHNNNLPLTSIRKRSRGSSLPKQSKPPSSYLPRTLSGQLKFKCTPDMFLDSEEIQACAFLFYKHARASESIVKARHFEAKRSDFECLIPGERVSSEIITLVCEKVRWEHKNKKNLKAVWCLPPSFADDVFMGMTTDELVGKYGKEWMIPYDKLKYIYVPVKTMTNHWYLLVVSIDDRTIYHFDSYLCANNVESRRQRIKVVAMTLAQMIYCPEYGEEYRGLSLNFGNWKIEEVRGIPNCGSSDNSAIWVLDWLERHKYFDNEVIGMVNENAIRMRTAATLMLGGYNELKSEVETKIVSFLESYVV